jgi:manganese/zinc/iron transport system substrate-binding protein
MWRTFSSFVLIVSVVALAGCTGSSADTNEKHNGGAKAKAQATFDGQYPIAVVCTTQQVADAVRHVAGERAEVVGLMGPGVDPHLYKARPADMQRLNKADMIFFNGLHLEGRMADLLVQMARKRPTFAVTESLQENSDQRLREPPEFEGHYDPHLWHDASIWADCVSYVAEQLAVFDPAQAAEYRKNAETYNAELLATHAWAAEQIGAIPAERRVLITAHDAFGYFGAAYDIEVHGLQGISTQDEPSVAAMEDLVKLLTQRKIKAVFVESSVPRRTVQALIEACRAQGHEVAIGGELFSDAMGDAGTPEADYLGMYKHNVHTIVNALK